VRCVCDGRATANPAKSWLHGAALALSTKRQRTDACGAGSTCGTRLVG